MCYLCEEEENLLDPRKEEDYQAWIDEQREECRRCVAALFRPLRVMVGLATLSDLVVEVWEENVRQQLRPADRINYTMPYVRKFN